MKLVLPFELHEADGQILDRELMPSWSVTCATGADYWTAMADADATVVLAWPGEAPAFEKLRLIQVFGAGYDAIDFSAAPANAWICNVYEHEIAIAEYVMAAMLEWCIGLRDMDERARRGDWSGTFQGTTGVNLHGELHGKTLGIIGYGHIGKETAIRAAAFGMQVLACSRSAGDGDDNVAAVEPMSRLDDMLARSDFVLVACPLTAATTGLLDAGRLAAMKSSAVVVNIARGPVIDEDALYEACRQRTIAGAVSTLR